jgi:phosphonate transport system ATP-binding protein
MFNLNRVTVAYNGQPALKDLSLTIEEGEQVVIIGQSGSGKSTLLRKLFDLHSDRAAFVHQDYALVPQLSVFHNIYAGRLDRRNILRNLLTLIKPHKNDLDEIRSIVSELGLEEKLLDRVGELSGGQQQRVAVARAIYRQNDVLMGDEPVSSVDPRQAGDILNLLKRSTKTLILAMHDVDLALTNFDRIIGLRSGVLAFDLPSGQVTPQILTDLYEQC